MANTSSTGYQLFTEPILASKNMTYVDSKPSHYHFLFFYLLLSGQDTQSLHAMSSLVPRLEHDPVCFRLGKDRYSRAYLKYGVRGRHEVDVRRLDRVLLFGLVERRQRVELESPHRARFTRPSEFASGGKWRVGRSRSKPHRTIARPCE